jgi:hypothetical protein
VQLSPIFWCNTSSWKSVHDDYKSNRKWRNLGVGLFRSCSNLKNACPSLVHEHSSSHSRTNQSLPLMWCSNLMHTVAERRKSYIFSHHVRAMNALLAVCVSICRTCTVQLCQLSSCTSLHKGTTAPLAHLMRLAALQSVCV